VVDTLVGNSNQKITQIILDSILTQHRYILVTCLLYAKFV
jgi:hypothetical protein